MYLLFLRSYSCDKRLATDGLDYRQQRLITGMAMRYVAARGTSHDSSTAAVSSLVYYTTLL